VGPHSITASYSGDTNYSPNASTPLTQTVNKQTATVALASSANPSTYGSTVIFTATVTPATATGTMTFTDGGTTLGTGTISGGIATYSTSTLAAGPHSITASYGGDANDSSGASSAITQTTNPVPQVASTPLPAGTAGTSYSATLAASDGTPPYTWSISLGSLPSGLSLNGDTGAISGTPTVEGARNFTVQVTDANNISATQPLSIVVAAVITAVSPGFGPAGTAVTISGTGFGTTPGTVTFNGAAATTITSWGTTSIVVKVPTGTGSGTVVVTVAGASSNGFSFTTTTGATQANLDASRYQHSSTLLNNGQILVAGGVNCPTPGSCTYLSTAELYNPDTSKFSDTGTMGAARSAPAVLLSTGKVLTAGGYTCDHSGNCSSLRSAEIYDPTAGTFSSAGTMTVARSGHTMTVLGNGTVLIAGGENCTSASSCSALASAEIYDPNAGTFSPTSNDMGVARFGASAVLLDSGFVLIAGGFDGASLPAAAELYNPASGIGFTGTGANLSVPRFDASATLMNNGRVLVSGGSTCNLPGCPTNAAEIYDPVANTFSVVSGGMMVPRFDHTTTLLTNGNVMVAGGYSSCGSTCNEEASTELFDPITGAFTSAQPIGTALAGHTATVLANGSALLIGGIDAGVTLAGDELYQPGSLTPSGLVSIAIAPASLSLVPGQFEPLAATGSFNDNSTQTLHSVIWNSSNPSVAAVSNPFGIAAAQNTGAITLTATAGTVSGSASLTVLNQGSVTIASTANPSAFGSPVTFTATVRPATATGTVTFTDGSTALGTGTINSGSATYTLSTLAVGSHSITASYSGDGNDSSSTSPVLTQTVNQAAPTITWTTPAAITYGTGLSATQLNATASVPGTFAYAPTAGTALAAGTQTLGVTFTPTDTTDYATVTGTVLLVVTQATPAITWPTPAAITYGTALSATQLDATANVQGTFVYTPAAGTALAAGTQTLGLTFTPTNTTNYTTMTATVSLLVNQATLAITWPTPAAITYGTALSATQLDATANVPGTFAYTPTTGTVLGAGARTLSVSFTPTDTADYTTASGTASLVVNQATPTITWATPAAITYGTALSATQLDATASVPGTFSYSPAAGTALAAGTQALGVTFTPTDTADYTTASATVSLVVNQATATLTLASSANPVAFGLPLTFTATVAPATATGTVTFADSSTTLGTVPISTGVATYSTSTLAAGSHSITASYSGDTNDTSSASTALTQAINTIPQVVTTSLSGGTAGASYLATLTVSGGAAPYTWSINSGSLPAGLSLNNSTGAILGTPAVVETSNFTVQATDANGIVATQPLSIVVSAQVPQLPLAWVDNNEATDGLVHTPPSYEYILGASSWVTGPPPGCSLSLPYAVTAAGKQAAINALEACRTATGHGSILDVPPGIMQSANGIVIPQTNTVLAAQFIIIRSTQEAALVALGEPVCAGGTQDNVSASTAPGLINPDCAGDHLAYQLGTTITPISAGAFTLANGTVTNTSAYNFHQYMYEDQCTGTGCVALRLCSNAPGTLQSCGGSTAIGPDHWLFEDGAASMSPGNLGNNDVVSCGSGNPTALSQYAYHIHFRRYWSHGDWTSLATGANQVSSAFNMTDCGYSSIVGSQMSQALRPGGEGHAATLNGPGPFKIDNNWFEGQSSSVFIGGLPVTPVIAGYVPGNDVEIRRNRLTFPYGWLGLSTISGNPHYSNSIARKNCMELKEGQRILMSGNICENVDNSGGQNGAVTQLIVRNKSSGAGGQNYQAVIADVTIADSIYRNACRDMSLAARSASTTGNGGGVSETMARVWLDNVLHYGITSSSPGCPVGTTGMSVVSNGASWVGTITENGSGTQAQFVATCSVDGGDCPSGPPSPGFEVMNINAGDPVSISGCTSVPAFNVATHSACGRSGLAAGIGPKAIIGSTPWSGSYNPAGVSVVYPWAAPPNAQDSSGTCQITNLESGPQALLITHNSFITDLQNAIGAGPAPSAGPSYQTNHLFRDSIILSGNNPRGWNNSACGPGTPTENFDYDTTTMTADHLVLPMESASSYTEFGNHPNYSNPFCSTPGGCSPTVTFRFPTTDYCTGATSTSACVGFTGAMSLPAGPMPVALSDYHGYVLRSDSSFHAAASDGSDIGVNIPAIDAAQTTNLYVCTSFCGNPGPFPDE
jgi:hypothetical protein